MNDSPCKRITQLEAERIELLATLADTSARADQFEAAIRDTIIVLETVLPSRLVTVLLEKLRAALEESDDP